MSSSPSPSNVERAWKGKIEELRAKGIRFSEKCIKSQNDILLLTDGHIGRVLDWRDIKKVKETVDKTTKKVALNDRKDYISTTGEQLLKDLDKFRIDRQSREKKIKSAVKEIEDNYETACGQNLHATLMTLLNKYGNLDIARERVDIAALHSDELMMLEKEAHKTKKRLEGQIEEAKDQIRRLQAELEDKRKDITRLKKPQPLPDSTIRELKDLMEAVGEQREKIGRRDGTVKSLKADIAKKDATILQLNNRIITLEADYKKEKGGLEMDWNNQLQELRREMEGLIEKVAELENDVRTKDETIGELQKSCNAAKRDSKKKTELLHTEKSARRKLESDLSNSNIAKDKLKNVIGELEESNAALQATNDGHVAEKTEMARQIELKDVELNDTIKDLSGLKAQCLEWTTELIDRANTITDLKKNVKRVEEMNVKTEERKNKCEEKIQFLEGGLKESGRQLDKITMDVINTLKPILEYQRAPGKPEKKTPAEYLAETRGFWPALEFTHSRYPTLKEEHGKQVAQTKAAMTLLLSANRATQKTLKANEARSKVAMALMLGSSRAANNRLSAERVRFQEGLRNKDAECQRDLDNQILYSKVVVNILMICLRMTNSRLKEEKSYSKRLRVALTFAIRGYRAIKTRLDDERLRWQDVLKNQHTCAKAAMTLMASGSLMVNAFIVEERIQWQKVLRSHDIQSKAALTLAMAGIRSVKIRLEEEKAQGQKNSFAARERSTLLEEDIVGLQNNVNGLQVELESLKQEHSDQSMQLRQREDEIVEARVEGNRLLEECESLTNKISHQTKEMELLHQQVDTLRDSGTSSQKELESLTKVHSEKMCLLQQLQESLASKSNECVKLVQDHAEEVRVGLFKRIRQLNGARRQRLKQTKITACLYKSSKLECQQMVKTLGRTEESLDRSQELVRVQCENIEMLHEAVTQKDLEIVTLNSKIEIVEGKVATKIWKILRLLKLTERIKERTRAIAIYCMGWRALYLLERERKAQRIEEMQESIRGWEDDADAYYGAFTMQKTQTLVWMTLFKLRKDASLRAKWQNDQVKGLKNRQIKMLEGKLVSLERSRDVQVTVWRRLFYKMWKEREFLGGVLELAMRDACPTKSSPRIMQHIASGAELGDNSMIHLVPRRLDITIPPHLENYHTPRLDEGSLLGTAISFYNEALSTVRDNGTVFLLIQNIHRHLIKEDGSSRLILQIIGMGIGLWLKVIREVLGDTVDKLLSFAIHQLAFVLSRSELIEIDMTHSDQNIKLMIEKIEIDQLNLGKIGKRAWQDKMIVYDTVGLVSSGSYVYWITLRPEIGLTVVPKNAFREYHTDMTEEYVFEYEPPDIRSNIQRTRFNGEDDEHRRWWLREMVDFMNADLEDVYEWMNGWATKDS